MGLAKYHARQPIAAQHPATMIKGFVLGLVAAGVLSLPVNAAVKLAPVASTPEASESVRRMADWVGSSGDNGILPFAIVDKTDAKVFVFDARGRQLGAALVLLGLAKGDDSIPGIGTMPLAKITPSMRTTPAGRFVAALGPDLGKLDVLWVDYPDAISLHRVINTIPAERRLKRIVSKTPADHRISYGCINVPIAFFNTVVEPTFKGTGVVYILPEVKPMSVVFPAYYEVGTNPALQTNPEAAAE